jgi:hypothetical protein
MEADSIQGAVIRAFWAALLLGCDTTTAEAAVLDGIGACENISPRSLLIEVVKGTLLRRVNSAVPPDAVRVFLAEPSEELVWLFTGCGHTRGTALF